jgi:hypothetical protein
MARRKISVDPAKWLTDLKARYESPSEAVIRELLLNAADSLYFSALEDPTRRADLCIEYGTIRGERGEGFFLRDNGLGLTEEALRSLRKVGESATRARVVREGATALELEPGVKVQPFGEFGEGIYSTGLVASEVVIRSRCRRTGVAVDWCFFPEECAYEERAIPAAEAEAREFGASVEVILDPRSEAALLLRSADWLDSLILQVGDFLPWPIRKAGEKGIKNRRRGPWDVPESTAESFAACLSAHELLMSREKIQFLLPLATRPDTGFGGVLFMGDAGVERGVALYSSRVLVRRSVDFLPAGFRWLSGIVTCNDLEVNEARENLQRQGGSLERLQQRLLSWILCGDPRWTSPTVLTPPFLQDDAYVPGGGLSGLLREASSARARNALLGGPLWMKLVQSAASSAACAAALARNLPLPLVPGSHATLAELDVGPGRNLHVLRDSGQKRTAEEFARRGVPVLDARMHEVGALLRQLERAGLHLRVVADQIAPELPDQRDWAELTELFRQLDLRVGPIRFEPLGRAMPVRVDTASLPRADEAGFLNFLRKSLEDKPALDPERQFQQDYLKKQSLPLLVNIDAPIIRLLRECSRPRRGLALSLLSTLVAHAIAQTGFSFEEGLRLHHAHMHAEALHDLVDLASQAAGTPAEAVARAGHGR